MTFQKHPGNMERAFVHVSLCRLRERPVVMEIAEPFAVFLVWKTGIVYSLIIWCISRYLGSPVAS